MHSPHFLASTLAAALLDGTWSVRSMQTRAARTFRSQPRGLRGLIRRVVAAFPERSAVGLDGLTEFLLPHVRFPQHDDFVEVCRVSWPASVMEPTADVVRGWGLPEIASPRQLADWLGLTLPQLDWFADVKRRNRRAPPGPLRHYTVHIIRKRDGRLRLLEAPRPRLKSVQRRILHDLLARVPPHDAAHGFRPGRSVVTYAAPHAGQAMVLRLDLCDFFASVTAARVRALFRTLGYPREVAHLLTGLCTHVTPADAWPADTSPDDRATRRRHADPHLPQGAPTSPALANLCAYRLDVRLRSLAAAAGANYTRYADDLAFSGGPDFARAADRFLVQAATVVLEEGFEVRMKKTRWMRSGARQHLAGVVINVRPNVTRDEYDRLKAILHNCRRSGPTSQNRADVPDFRAHLLGRIAHVAALHPERGQKLRTLFHAVRWDDGPR
jgi:RNA-directed DNA polymerase